MIAAARAGSRKSFRGNSAHQPINRRRLSSAHAAVPSCQRLAGRFRASGGGARISELGFADHNPMPEPFDDWRMDLDDLPRYLEA